jgi:hypothetical protein
LPGDIVTSFDAAALTSTAAFNEDSVNVLEALDPVCVRSSALADVISRALPTRCSSSSSRLRRIIWVCNCFTSSRASRTSVVKSSTRTANNTHTTKSAPAAVAPPQLLIEFAP